MLRSFLPVRKWRVVCPSVAERQAGRQSDRQTVKTQSVCVKATVRDQLPHIQQ